VSGHRAVVVLDDDPTGTQCSRDLPVLLDPAADPTPELTGGDGAVHILTNTRALPAVEAVRLVRSVRERVDAAAARLGVEVEYVLRGDSTLRGHVFAEADAFGAAGQVLLFVPAFPAAGRTTAGGVHYVEVDGRRVPASETEFARDPVFGYTTSTMVDWVREQGARPAYSVPAAGVARALATAPPGAVVVPDAGADADLALVSAALDGARAAGRGVVVRCAAPFAALRSGHLATSPVAGTPSLGPTLVVCGSHTGASTAQLAALADHLAAPVRTLSTVAALTEPAGAAGRLATAATADLTDRGLAILASERVRRAEHHRLDHGEAVMRALCAAVAQLRHHGLTAVIAKGGITSAEVARHGLGARRARVRGPLLTGVARWRVPVGTATVDYAVVPGNVGGARTLIDVAHALGVVSPSPTPRS